MPKPLPITLAVLASTSLLLLGGCATSKDKVLPQGLKPMKQIYAEHFDELRGSDVDGARAALASRGETEPTTPAGTVRPMASGQVDLAGYTRDAYNEIEGRFPRLANPTLVMFVYPHLAGPQGVPIPGYATTFPMYQSVDYALPGEDWEAL